jgi:hypothetical protein
MKLLTLAVLVSALSAGCLGDNDFPTQDAGPDVDAPAAPEVHCGDAPAVPYVALSHLGYDTLTTEEISALRYYTDRSGVWIECAKGYGVPR